MQRTPHTLEELKASIRREIDSVSEDDMGGSPGDVSENLLRKRSERRAEE